MNVLVCDVCGCQVEDDYDNRHSWDIIESLGVYVCEVCSVSLVNMCVLDPLHEGIHDIARGVVIKAFRDSMTSCVGEYLKQALAEQ